MRKKKELLFEPARVLLLRVVMNKGTGVSGFA
jgi:hypothetical protein